MTISAVGYVKQNYESFMTRTEKNKTTDSLYERMSRELLANQEETEQEEEKELTESERIKSGQTEVLRGSRLQMHLSGEDKKAPYYHLSNNGMIEYKGVTFFCDTQKNQLQLGDISDEHGQSEGQDSPPWGALGHVPAAKAGRPFGFGLVHVYTSCTDFFMIQYTTKL